MLGEDLERNIREAWLRVRKDILNDPQELQRRLARRGMKALRRPPRAWCLAIRASDRRITPAHWVIVAGACDGFGCIRSILMSRSSMR
jgi:hypothetical protein